MTTLPSGTLLDRDPMGLTPEEIAVVKAIYVSWDQFEPIRAERGLSPAQMVDCLERLRRRGYVDLVSTEGAVYLRPTPTGAVANWMSQNS